MVDWATQLTADKKEQSWADQLKNLGVAADPSRSTAERESAQQSLTKSGIHTPSVKEQDIRTREEFLAQQTGRESLGEPGLQDFTLRADLGLSDTFEEKKAKFLEKFPDGDFIMAFEPRQSETARPQTILFRRHQDEDFSELDARAIERFELLMDISDISGEVPAAVMEAVLIRGGSRLKQMWRAVVGTGTGDALKEGIEEARGYQRETLPQIARRESVRLPLSAAGAGAVSLMRGPLNTFRGASGIALKESAPAAQRAAQRMGLPPFLPGQIARSPFLQKMQGQAGAIFRTVSDYISAQQGAIARALGRLREGDMKKVLADELEDVFDSAKNQIVLAAQLSPRRSLTEGGTAIQQGIAEWDDLANGMVRLAYRRANNIEAPVFDITSLKTVARDLKTGVRGASGEGTIPLSQIDPDLDRVATAILELDPALPTVSVNGLESTAIDQLRALRSQLWDMKTPNAGEIARLPHSQASKLYAALTKAMRNPTNTNREFVEAWRKADAMASSRFGAMEQLMVIEAGRSQTPALLASKLAKPQQVDNLRVLRNTMPDSRWREFQESIKADFIAPQNINNLTRRIDGFDQPTMDMLMTKGDQDALRLIGQRIDELNQVGIKESLAKDATHAAIINRLAINNDTKSIGALAKLASTRPKLQRSIRAGLMEAAWDSAVSVRDGIRVVNKEAITEFIGNLRKSGAIGFLNRGDLRLLKEFELVAELVPEAIDTGTSLVAASAVSATTRFSTEGFRSLIKNMTIGRILTSPTINQWILGKGKAPLPFNTLVNFGSFLGRELQSLPDTGQTISDIPPPEEFRELQ